MKILWLLLLTAGAWSAEAKLKVVATLPDYAAVAEAVGGAAVQVTSLARGSEDPHFVDPKPGFIRMLNQADLLIDSGAELEIGWLPPLLEAARNPKLRDQGPGRFAASEGIEMLDIPEGKVDRSLGDVHASGNPHFMLDPVNAGLVARRLAGKLSALDPPNRDLYERQAEQFQSEIKARTAAWAAKLEPLKGARVITYHKTYDYLARRFGIMVVGQVEPRPGIEPSPSAVQGLVNRWGAEGIRQVWMEPNRNRKTAARVAEALGARLVLLPALPRGESAEESYLQFMDRLVARLIEQPSGRR